MFEKSGIHTHNNPHVFEQSVNLNGPLAGRGGMSSPIWRNAPIRGLCDPGYASFFFDDFFSLVTADEWTIEGDTGLAPILDGTADGIVSISPTAVTDTHTGMIHTTNAMWKIDGAKKIFFEASVTCTEAVATKAGLFVGMSAGTFASDIPLVDASTPTTDDRIAFWKVDTTGTEWQCGTSVGATQDDATSNVDFTSAQTYKLGFIADATEVQFYIDNQLVRTVTDTDDIPDAAMHICVLVKNGSGTKETITCDWVKCVQIR